ncbi:Uncharacterized protein Fot_32495 [Forsythia ovata]|uniref:Uncharacterized protein n=1 Tax=Forsythia ovata TaxID=205694 RepID=A0ABD1T8H9_9LAMI
MPIDVFSIVSGEWVVAAERRETRWITTTDFWSYLTHAPGYYIWEYTVIRTEVYDMNNNGWFLKGIYLEFEIQGHVVFRPNEPVRNKHNNKYTIAFIRTSNDTNLRKEAHTGFVFGFQARAMARARARR